MYAETGLMFPYFQNLPLEVQQFEESGCSQNASSDIPSSVIQASAVSDYNLWGECDLFYAPEPVFQDPVMDIDPMTAAISMISFEEDIISTQSLTVSDIESSIDSWQLLSEVFYECKKDILAKEGNEMPPSEVDSINIPAVKTDENLMTDEKPLGNDYISDVQSPRTQPRAINSCTSEERREKLSRYWSKKSKRNFSRKIKYACRKALADSQPRIRGRFAKTEETEAPQKL